MSKNKQALLRYQAIDRLFCTSGYVTIEQIQNACSNALSPDGSITVSRVTIYSDLKALEQEFHLNIEKTNTRPVRYCYAEGSLTLYGHTYMGDNYAFIQDTIDNLGNIGGLLSVEGTVSRLKDKVSEMQDGYGDFIEFEGASVSCQYDSLRWKLFSYIKDAKPLVMEYSRNFLETVEYDIQPFYLKEYDNRWYLIAWKYYSTTTPAGGLRTFALDRIVEVSVNRSRRMIPELIKENDFNGKEYFKDIIGVTIPKEATLQRVTLKMDLSDDDQKHDYERLVSKPLHPSQWTEPRGAIGYVYLDIIPNEELISELLKYEHVEVEGSEKVRDMFLGRLHAIASHYPEEFKPADGNQSEQEDLCT